MALITEVAQLRLSMEGQQVIKTLTLLEQGSKKLNTEQKDLVKQQKDLEKAFDKTNNTYQKQKEKLLEIGRTQGENSAKYIAQKQKVDALNATLAENTKKHDEVEAALKAVNHQIGENNAKMTELRQSEGDLLRTTQSLIFEKRSLSKEMLNSTFGTDKYNEALKRTLEIEKELDTRSKLSGRNAGFGNTPKIEPPATLNPIQEFLGGIGSKIAQLAILQKALELIWAGITKAYAEARQLSKAEGATAARLGLETGSKELKELSETATQMGDAFNKSTVDVLTAVQQIGSIRPELMKDSKALSALTEDALLLSGADGLLSVEDAGIAVAGSLNQFGEQANQSRRYANALAASAKEGSAEINQVAESFKKSGTVLAQNNISFEQGNALVQVLAKKMILGEEAGTNLRNIFLSLTAQTNENLNPAIVGLGTALDNLAKLSPQEIIKLFGKENDVAATTIIAERKEVERLTHAISGTNEVISQFHKQIGTLDGDAEKFGHVWDGIFEDFGKKYEGLFRKITQLGTETLNYLRYFKLGIAIGDKDNTNGIIFEGYGDVKKEQAIQAEYKKQAAQAQADARKTISEYEKSSNKSATILQKQLSGIHSIVSQSQAGISETMDRYLKARKNNASKEQIQEILNDKKYFEAKYKFARKEELRLKTNETKRVQTAKDLTSSPDKDDQKAIDKAAKKAEKIADKEQAEAKKAAEQKAQDLIKNEEDALAQIEALQIAAIDDELERERVKLTEKNFDEIEAERKKIEAGVLSQKTFEALQKQKNQTLQDELDKLDKKQEENALKAAKTQAEADLNNAKATGDEKEILAKEIALNIVEEQIAILTAGEELHTSIHEKFESERAKISAKFAQKSEDEKAKTRKSFEDARERYENQQADKKHREEVDAAEKLETAKRDFKQKAAQTAETAIFNFIKAGINNQITEEDAKYQKLVALNDQQLANKQITQAEHDKNALALEDKHQKKIIELKKKQAIYDKAKAILDIAINTATGVVKAASGIVTAPLIPWIIATGAIEAAAVAAQPLPEYFYGGYTGTGNGPKVNDGKGGFLAINHPNELIVSNADLNTDWGQAIQQIYESRTINNSIFNTTTTQAQTIPMKSNQGVDNQLVSKVLSRTADVIETLQTTIQNGITAKTHFTAHDIDNISKIQGQNAKIKQDSLNN